MAQMMAATIGIAIVIILLPFSFFVVHKNEKFKELKRLVDQQTKVLDHMGMHLRKLDNDFVHLEGRVDDLAEDVRELRQKQLNPES
jgi:uncharacterized protein YoxC